MKIGLVCPYNVTLGGGVQEVVFALQKHLARRGHSVKIITARPRRFRELNTSDIIFLGSSIDLRWPNHTTAPLSSGLSNEAIDQAIEAERFDVMHFHEPWVPVLSRQILARSRSVNVATFHAKVQETIVNKSLSLVITPYLRTVLDDLDELTAVSEPAAEYVTSLTSRPITLIPNGIDLEHFRYAANRDDQSPKTILYIGRLEGRKGLRYLLRACELLCQEMPDVRVVIAGSGPDRWRLELLAKSLGLANVTFLGYVTDEQKVQLLSEADLFCSPALFGESFGIVLLEAMASGLPTVAGDNSGYASLMQGVGSLSLVNPRDARELARRMKLLLEEPKIRSLWRTWARVYVKQFAYEKVARQYEQLYVRAVAAHKK